MPKCIESDLRPVGEGSLTSPFTALGELSVVGVLLGPTTGFGASVGATTGASPKRVA